MILPYQKLHEPQLKKSQPFSEIRNKKFIQAMKMKSLLKYFFTIMTIQCI